MLRILAPYRQPALATWLGLHYAPPASMSRRSSRLSGGNTPGPSTYSTRATVNSATRPQAGSDDSTPYFEEWPTEALQAEVKRYGFKVSRKRATLIDQLKAVYAALDRYNTAYEPPTHTHAAAIPEATVQETRKRKLVLPSTAPSVGDVVKATGKGKGRGRKSDPFELVSSSDSSSSQPEAVATIDAHDETGDLTAQLELEALSATDGSPSPASNAFNDSDDGDGSDVPLSSPSKARPRRSSASSDDVPLALQMQAEQEGEAEQGDGEAVDPSPVLAQVMTAAIRADADVWRRVLRFEPISFDEFVSIATRNALAMDTGKSKEKLRTWLDRQCICFYSAELTGARSRH